MAEPHELVSDAGRNALGYLGGGILALSLVPQIIRLLMTKSAEDISLLWSLLYFLGEHQRQQVFHTAYHVRYC